MVCSKCRINEVHVATGIPTRDLIIGAETYRRKNKKAEKFSISN